jgi:hypothetical protein
MPSMKKEKELTRYQTTPIQRRSTGCASRDEVLMRDIDNGEGDGTVFSEFSDVPDQKVSVSEREGEVRERTRRP